MKVREKMFQYENNADAVSDLHPVIPQVTCKSHSVDSHGWRGDGPPQASGR